MEAQRMMWIDLDSIINDYLGESEQSDHKYKKCYDLAHRAMDDLGLDFFYQIKSVRIPVNGNKTFSFPADCLQWSKVGYFDYGGNLIPMKCNGNLSAFANQLPNRSLRLSVMNTLLNDGCGWSNVFCNYNDGGRLTYLYGATNFEVYTGTFKIDNHTGVVMLSPSFAYTDLCLEYVANPEQTDESPVVPIQFREAIIAWLSWKDIKSLPPSRRGSIGDKQTRKSDYYNERRNAIRKYKPFRLEQHGIIFSTRGTPSSGAGGATVLPPVVPASTVVIPDLSAYQPLVDQTIIIQSSTSATVEHTKNFIELDASTNPVVYTINPALVSGRTLHIRCSHDTNGVTVNTLNAAIIEMMNGDNQTEVQMLNRNVLTLRSNGTKLIEI